MTDFHEIQQLINLFNPNRDEDNSDDDYTDTPISSSNKFNTETKEASTRKKINPYAKIEVPEKQHKEITDADLDYFDAVPEASANWKKTPKWRINYKQSVSAEDVFLQMGAKSPSTASCEDMIIVVELPGERMQNMNINVLKEKLEVTSPNFSLQIPLPHPVDPQKGDAKWDKDKEELMVNLRMDREFDFVNF